MECVSPVLLATCLTVSPNATQAMDGEQNSWIINSSHAALSDCMRDWTFSKGTAASRRYQLYLESPPISPRSGPTQVGISVPHLSLEEAEDSVLLNTADSMEENNLDFSDERYSEHSRSSLSSTGVEDTGVLQGALFPVEIGNPMDYLKARLIPLQRDDSSISEMMGSADKVIQRKSSGAAGQASFTEVAQALKRPNELNAPTQELDDNRHSHTTKRLMSPQSYHSSTSVARSTKNSTKPQSDLLPDENEVFIRCNSDTILHPEGLINNQEAESHDRSTLSSPDSRNPEKYRIEEKTTRWPQFSSKPGRDNMTNPQYERLMRVDKPRQTNFRKHHSQLQRPHSTDFDYTPERPNNSDQCDLLVAIWKIQRSCSSGAVSSTDGSDSHLPRELPAAISDDQFSSDNRPTPAGTIPVDTSAESLSSCDETETDVSDIERPHPLDSQRDQMVSLLLQRYMSYRSKSEQQDARSRGNDTGSGSQTGNGQPQSNTSRGQQAAGQKRKRSSGSQEDDDGVENDDKAAPRKRKRPKQTAEKSNEHQSFACPFSKKSPSKYRRCYRYDLKRIRDVKQHLRRCHRRAVYCPVCSETFASEEARDAHVRQRTCVERPGVTIEGISEVQAQSLSGKCSTKISAEQQWFHVFGVCFPGHAPPRSPYVDRHLSEELQSFRDYASVDSPSIILEEMRRLREWNEEDTSFLRQALGDGLERIADLWSQGLDSEGTTELKYTPSTATVCHPSLHSSTTASHTLPQVSRTSRDCQGGDASASLRIMQEQLLGISSSGKDQHEVNATQAENSIYDFGTELFDISMLSTGAPAMTAPIDAEFPIEI